MVIAHQTNYSPCKICNQPGKRTPVWQVKAEKVVYDQVKHRIHFSDATVDFLGVPILYTPYLSAPDPTSIINLFGLLPFDPHAYLPSFLAMLSIGIWPILMGFTQFVQTKLNPAPADPVQARMFTLMPVIFTFMFATFPAGLVIYYTWNNLLTVTQQWFIMHREGVEVHLFENLKFGGKDKKDKK